MGRGGGVELCVCAGGKFKQNKVISKSFIISHFPQTAYRSMIAGSIVLAPLDFLEILASMNNVGSCVFMNHSWNLAGPHIPDPRGLQQAQPKGPRPQPQHGAQMVQGKPQHVANNANLPPKDSVGIIPQ